VVFDLAVFLEQKDILLNNIPEYILDEIKSYARKFPNQESCGIIFNNDSGLYFKPCDNLSERRDVYFAINPKILIDYNVLYVYHSHVNSSAKPSKLDKKMCDELCIPYLIYSLRDDDFYIYDSVGV